MSEDEARRAVIARLMEQSEQALAAAWREHAAGDLRLAINRIYYACFYAVSAVLLSENRQFAKHAGLRAALHQHLVKPGELSADLGEFYDEAFEGRQEADYGILAEFQAPSVAARIKGAEEFVGEMRRLLARR